MPFGLKRKGAASLNPKLRLQTQEKITIRIFYPGLVKKSEFAFIPHVSPSHAIHSIVGEAFAMKSITDRLLIQMKKKGDSSSPWYDLKKSDTYSSLRSSSMIVEPSDASFQLDVFVHLIGKVKEVEKKKKNKDEQAGPSSEAPPTKRMKKREPAAETGDDLETFHDAKE